jgi:amino acid transporter
MAAFPGGGVSCPFLPAPSLWAGARGVTGNHPVEDRAESAFDGSLYAAIGIAAGVALFSYIGVEVAAMTAKRVRNPRRRRVEGWLLARDLGIAGVAALFSMWVTFAAGWSAVYQAMVLVLAG